MSSLQSILTQLQKQFPDSSLETQARCLHELKRTFASTEWSVIINSSEELAITLNDLVDACVPTLGQTLLNILTDLAERLEDPNLSCVHVSLAALIAKHNLMNGDHTSRYLHLFAAESEELPPLSFDPDICRYFENCAIIVSKGGNWKDAAMHAALAMALDPTVERVRFWYLAELIANGEVADVPRQLWTSVSCPVVSGLAQHFGNKSQNDWMRLLAYCEEHNEEFREWNVEPLVNRALATYCVEWTAKILERITAVPIIKILKLIEYPPIGLNELVNAGLTNYCKIEDDLLIPKQKEVSDEITNEWLEHVASMAQLLQSSIYR